LVAIIYKKNWAHLKASPADVVTPSPSNSYSNAAAEEIVATLHNKA
jgi:hypothetical protein